MQSGLPSIGELTHRIELQTRSDTAASGGGTTEGYTTVATVWAKLVQVSGSLYFASQQIEKTVTHTFTIRGRSDVSGVGYVRWNGVRFRVERVRALDPVPRFQELLCEELKSGV